MQTGDRVVHYLQRHLAPLILAAKKDGLSHQFVVTAFVLSVQDEWFLVTAGHCLRDVESLESTLGYPITSCALVDSMGMGAKHEESIPFAYHNAGPQFVQESPEFGYGIVPLSRYYRQLLEANNVQPLTEEVWDKLPQRRRLLQAPRGSWRVGGVRPRVHFYRDYTA